VCANTANAVKKRFELVGVSVGSTLVAHPMVLDLLVLTFTNLKFLLPYPEFVAAY
jgi:hypothetical protein